MSDEPMIVRLAIASEDLGGEPGVVRLFRGPDDEYIIDTLRDHCERWLSYHIAAAATLLASLDFGAPNQPTSEDMQGVVDALDRAREKALALLHMAPVVFPDDDEAGS